MNFNWFVIQENWENGGGAIGNESTIIQTGSNTITVHQVDFG